MFVFPIDGHLVCVCGLVFVNGKVAMQQLYHGVGGCRWRAWLQCLQRVNVRPEAVVVFAGGGFDLDGAGVPGVGVVGGGVGADGDGE